MQTQKQTQTINRQYADHRRCACATASVWCLCLCLYRCLCLCLCLSVAASLALVALARHPPLRLPPPSRALLLRLASLVLRVCPHASASLASFLQADSYN
eukprot:2757012-Rhodomonas_salina.1